MFFGNSADYPQLAFSFSCSLCLHACIIALVCFLTLDQLPISYFVLNYAGPQSAQRLDLPQAKQAEQAPSEPDDQNERPELQSIPDSDEQEEIHHPSLQDQLPEDLIWLFTQWQIFPTAQQRSSDKETMPLPIKLKEQAPVSPQKAEKKKQLTQKEASPKAVIKEPQKIKPQEQKKSKSDKKEAKADTKVKAVEQPTKKAAQPKADTAQKPASNQKVTAPSKIKTAVKQSQPKPTIKQNALKKQQSIAPKSARQSGTATLTSPGAKDSALRTLTSAEGTSPIANAGRVSLEFTDSLSMKAVSSSDEYDAITHEMYESIKQAWEPLAGWEEAGPVIISVEAGAKAWTSEPHFVMKSYAAAKNQQAMSIARYIVKTGKAHGRTFNLTFK